MKTEMLLFIIKSNLAIVVFYGAYYLLLRKDAFFFVKRFVLLSFCIFALAIHFIPVTRSIPPGYDFLPALNTVFPQEVDADLLDDSDNNQMFYKLSSVDNIPAGVYLAGVAIVFCWLLVQVVRIVCVLMRSSKTQIRHSIVRISREDIPPFSFWNWIFLPDKEWDECELNEILIHEQAHVRQKHSFDTMLSSLLCALCWFNPFAWLLRKEIRMNLEYLADGIVLKSGCDMRHYQLHLLRLSHTKAAAHILNNFNVSPLKKRIVMMNKKQKSGIGLLKYLLLLPLAGSLTLANCSQKQGAGTGDATIIENEDNNRNVSDTGKIEKKIYEVVEEMPAFPGGVDALMTFLSENIRFPEDDKANKTGGRVVVKFIVDENGDVSDVRILKSVSESFDREAIRVVNAMPKWKPGRQNGENVPVYYALPIRFSVQNEGADQS